VLSVILQFVPQHNRYGSCALVSTAWAAAAAAVPVLHLSAVRSTTAALKAAWEAWGDRLAAHLTSLRLELADKDTQRSGDDRLAVTALPCPALRDLQLSGLTVQLAGPSCQASSQFPAKTAGRHANHLQGYFCNGSPVAPSTDGVLYGLPGLTRLCLQDVFLMGAPDQHMTALEALTGLQHLHMQVRVTQTAPCPPVQS
jgi:hypothetical protein